jgi:hypothetical protein
LQSGFLNTGYCIYDIMVPFEMLRATVGVLSHSTVAATAGAWQQKLLHVYGLVGRARDAAHRYTQCLE